MSTAKRVTDEERLRIIAGIKFLGAKDRAPDTLTSVIGPEGKPMTYREIATVQGCSVEGLEVRR